MTSAAHAAPAVDLGARLLVARNGMLSTSIRAIKVEGVREGCAAALAGIQAGDRILQVGDMQVLNASIFALKSKLDNAPDGSKIPVMLQRGSETLQVQLTAGVRCPK